MFHGAYARTTFGAFVDAWHSEVALMAHAPTADADDAGDGDDEDEQPGTAAVTH